MIECQEDERLYYARINSRDVCTGPPPPLYRTGGGGGGQEREMMIRYDEQFIKTGLSAKKKKEELFLPGKTSTHFSFRNIFL
jgi:hypothetical protein